MPLACVHVSPLIPPPAALLRPLKNFISFDGDHNSSEGGLLPACLPAYVGAGAVGVARSPAAWPYACSPWLAIAAHACLPPCQTCVAQRVLVLLSAHLPATCCPTSDHTHPARLTTPSVQCATSSGTPQRSSSCCLLPCLWAYSCTDLAPSPCSARRILVLVSPHLPAARAAGAGAGRRRRRPAGAAARCPAPPVSGK